MNEGNENGMDNLQHTITSNKSPGRNWKFKGKNLAYFGKRRWCFLNGNDAIWWAVVYEVSCDIFFGWIRGLLLAGRKRITPLPVRLYGYKGTLKLNKNVLRRLQNLWPLLPPNRDALIASCYQPKIQKNGSSNVVDEQEEDKCVTGVIQNAKEQVCLQKRRTNLLLQTSRQPVSFRHGRSLKCRT